LGYAWLGCASEKTQRRMVIPTSIRWRLPLSYAAIALLAALSLGAVLLTTLRNYYLRRELDYLMNNAQAISAAVTDLLERDTPPAALQSQLKSFSFLSQTRVRLLDEDQRLLADSGSVEIQREVIAVSLEEESALLLSLLGDSEVESEMGGDLETPSPGYSRTVSATLRNGSYRSFIVVEDENTTMTETVVITGTGLERLINPVDGFGPPPDPLGLVSRMPAVGTPYGFGFNPEIVPESRRSRRVVRYPFHNEAGDLLGYVELSEGPAYGRQILESVAWGWGIASSVAVVLAAGVGWFASRRISGPLGTLTNTTSRMAEGELTARADVTSEDELGLLARSFNEMAERVEETVVTLRRFATDAAHELRTPLTALRTDLELAASGRDEVERRAFIDRALTQLARLEALTMGLLELSRVESGAARDQDGPLDLVALVQKTSELYASQAEQIGLSFHLDLPAEVLVIEGNESRLRRALGNLLDNALKFTPVGGVVRIGARQDGAWAVVWVEDTGIGIPPGDLPHLFGRFCRGRNAADYPGSGLGLAIVKAIVESHGGQASAENTAQGARFSLRLPTNKPQTIVRERDGR
jgi:signal transduction histidine kinase